jgi:hypothetical protein
LSDTGVTVNLLLQPWQPLLPKPLPRNRETGLRQPVRYGH